MKRTLKTGLIALSLGLGGTMLLTGCAKEESAGDKVEEGMENAGEAATKAGEEMKESAEGLTND